MLSRCSSAGQALRFVVSVVAVAAWFHGPAQAHTVSIGYQGVGPGSVDFWYGSYHNNVGFNEGSLHLVGPNVNSIIAFTLLTTTKPSGLNDGVTNFYSNGTSLTGTPVPLNTNGGNFNGQAASVISWQGSQFSGLRPGTYTFTYIPIANPTQEWDPIDNVILTNTFTLTAFDILGIQSFAAFGTNQNQRAVGAALDAAITAGAFNQAFYNLAALSPADLANALSVLSGEVHAGAAPAAFQTMNPFLSAMLDPFGGGRGGFGPYGGGFDPNAGVDTDLQLRGSGSRAAQSGGSSYSGYGAGYGNGACSGAGAGPRYGSGYGQRSRPDSGCEQFPLEPKWSMWGTAYGAANSTAGNDVIGSHDTRTTVGGVAVGADVRLRPGTVAGFAVSMGSTAWSLANNLGDARAESMQVGVYGSTRLGPAYLSAAAAYAAHDTTIDRTLALAGTDRLESHFLGQGFGTRVEGGWRFGPAGFGVTPYAAAQAQIFRSPGYSEYAPSGSNTFALNIGAHSANEVRTELGLWVDRKFALNAYTGLMLRGRAAWAHDFAAAGTALGTFQNLAGGTFTVTGVTPAPNAALTSAAAELHFARGLAVGLRFDGEFASGSSTYGAKGTVRYAW